MERTEVWSRVETHLLLDIDKNSERISTPSTSILSINKGAYKIWHYKNAYIIIKQQIVKQLVHCHERHFFNVTSVTKIIAFSDK